MGNITSHLECSTDHRHIFGCETRNLRPFLEMIAAMGEEQPLHKAAVLPIWQLSDQQHDRRDF
jgi:hypothetical protein